MDTSKEHPGQNSYLQPQIDRDGMEAFTRQGLHSRRIQTELGSLWQSQREELPRIGSVVSHVEDNLLSLLEVF